MEIEDFIQLIKDVIEHYKSRGIEVSHIEIEDALFLLLSDEFEFEWRGSLWDVDISLNEALSKLSDFNFSTLHQVVEIDRNYFPDSLLISYKVKVKSSGLVWVIHRYDADPFPSNPHAHQLDNNLKMDLSNGKCYKGKRFVHSIPKKVLLDVRRKAESVFKGVLPSLTI